MKILVTGAGGFLGGAIVDKLLKQGHTVSALGRQPQPYLTKQGVTVYCGDIADYKAVHRATKGAEAIFHVAAKAGVWGSYESYFRPNVIGTRNILKACDEHKIPYLVYTSTPSVVSCSGNVRGVDESAPYGKDWLCPYAKTKAIAEQEVLQSNCTVKLNTVAIRPHLIWGPGDPHLLPKVLERARQQRLKIIGNGHNCVDITHIDNAAHAHLLALEALQSGRAAGKAYFIGQEKPVQLWKWLNQILLGVGLKPITRKVPLKLAYAVGYLLETTYKVLSINQEPPMTRFVATMLATDHYFNLAAAHKDLGYTPLISTEKGTQELIDSFLSCS